VHALPGDIRAVADPHAVRRLIALAARIGRALARRASRAAPALKKFMPRCAPQRDGGAGASHRAARCALLRCSLLLLAALLPPSAHASNTPIEPVHAYQPPAEPARAQGAVSIRVQRGGWGTADERDIARVLSYVADLLAPAFPRHAGDVIDIAYRPEGPVTLLERMPDGAYRVYLTVRDTRWDQFTYQFSHEYCHIVTNAEQRVRQDATVRGTQWFEESMCEAVSLLALRRVGARWERSAPVPTVPGYASAFGEYADQMTVQPHRRLPTDAPPDKPLENWFAVNRADLQGDPYLRKKNELVASALYAWLGSSPTALEAIGYIGVTDLQTGTDAQVFAAYLERWRLSSPERLRPDMMRVPALFGIASPLAPPTGFVGR
jgi:hypothetical protein